MRASQVLLLPGWQGSDAAQWQSLWALAHGYQRVEQHDWRLALRGDWIARLEEVLLSIDTEHDGPAVLVAHGLGCQLVAAWAAHSRQTHRVKAALLVAPMDVAQEALQAVLPSWSGAALRALPFRSVLLASRDDPRCTFERARQYAGHWACDCVDAGEGAHLARPGSLGGPDTWPEGQRHLAELMAYQPTVSV